MDCEPRSTKCRQQRTEMLWVNDVEAWNECVFLPCLMSEETGIAEENNILRKKKWSKFDGRRHLEGFECYECRDRTGTLA